MEKSVLVLGLVNYKKKTREVAIPCPGNDTVLRVGNLGFHGKRFPAGRLEVFARAGGRWDSHDCVFWPW